MTAKFGLPCLLLVRCRTCVVITPMVTDPDSPWTIKNFQSTYYRSLLPTGSFLFVPVSTGGALSPPINGGRKGRENSREGRGREFFFPSCCFGFARLLWGVEKTFGGHKSLKLPYIPSSMNRTFSSLRTDGSHRPSWSHGRFGTEAKKNGRNGRSENMHHLRHSSWQLICEKRFHNLDYVIKNIAESFLLQQDFLYLQVF